MENIIKKILDIAVDAPSGENAQPWRFVARENEISVFNIPERDQSLYNFNQLGSYVAHGALIENIRIASFMLGYSARIVLFPDNTNPDLVAVISLEKSLPADEPLYDYIEERATNRKPYQAKPLTQEQLNGLINTSKEIGEGEAMFIQDREKIKILAESASVNERVMFSNQFLHNFFFSHINWTLGEELKKRIGFYIKTLELPPPAQAVFKLLKYWPLMKVLNKIGLAKTIAATNAKVYASCAAMGAIVMKGDAPKDFVTAGRIMQRVWLKVAEMGLSIQPLTGALFFMQQINAGNTEKFSTEHIELIKNGYQNIIKTFEIKSERVIMMFRVGIADPPTARATKLSPEIKWS